MADTFNKSSNQGSVGSDITDKSLGLHSFGQVATTDVLKTIKSMANKSCSLDPIPTWLLKQCLTELVPVITAIINSTFQSGNIPSDLKKAIVLPVLKKSNLDHQCLNNFRPVSNIPFISKVLEKIVARKLNGYIFSNSLQEPLQSAYTNKHSTETALVKIHNDLTQAVDRVGAAVLVLLDLSAAFDTIDHSTMITRLKDHGISGKALQWFSSYLSQRTQTISIRKSVSSIKCLRCVPQGSVWGPFFSTFTFPL